MSTDRHLEERLRAAAPPPDPPPDVTALWRRSQRWRSYRQTAVGLAVAVVVAAVSVVVVGALRPAVELAPGATADDETTSAAERDIEYCAAAASFLEGVLGARDGSEDDPSTTMASEDFRASHATLRAEVAGAADVAPVELSGDWQAVHDDLLAQGEVWESIGWDPDNSGGWPELIRELNSLPTSAAGSAAIMALAADYEDRCQ